MNKERLVALASALRPYQWIKNLSIFAAIIFTGQLFNFPLFWRSFLGFIALCLLSSASYLFNDLVDAPLDRKHPAKKHRPIASGKLPQTFAVWALIFLSFLGLILAISLSFGFFLISLVFFVLHLFYSLHFKKYALLDILSISASFFIRVLSGDILTSFHVPVWLLLTTLFLALFIASAKRHAEFLRSGKKTRPALARYHEKLLDFYASTFATATFLSYALFAFLEEPPKFSPTLSQFLLINYPKALGRKWMMLTIPFVLGGVMRYGQLIYEQKEGEAPEKIITQDKPLMTMILCWGLTVILIIYII